MAFSLNSPVQSMHPPLHAFDLSHNHFTTFNFSKVYPVAWFECVPGDIFDISFQAMIRALPMVAPILNNITVNIDAYFVPTRLIWKDWVKFYTQVDDETIPLRTFVGVPPSWMFSDDGHEPYFNVAGSTVSENVYTGSDSLWNRFGFRSIFNNQDMIPIYTKGVLSDSFLLPIDFLRRCYWFIRNEWYRDENLQVPIDFTNPYLTSDHSLVDVGQIQEKVFTRALKKDYFTAAFTSRQKGIAPTIPLLGVGSAKFGNVLPSKNDMILKNYFRFLGDGGEINLYNQSSMSNGSSSPVNVIKGSGNLGANNTIMSGLDPDMAQAFITYLNNNTVSSENFTSLDMADFRDMSAIQQYFEKLMYMGSRYIEVLQGIFGTSPTDARLSIPERIGGASFNFNISEVVSTTEYTSADITVPQGNQSGHGFSKTMGKIGNYKCEEFGFILILLDIQVPNIYSQRMPREVMRRSLLELYSPFFVNLSFQAIHNYEIYYTYDQSSSDIWAYQGRYDEMREKMSYVSGELLDTQAYYVQQRTFANKPSFNEDFITALPSNNIFAVTDLDPFVANLYWDVKALRPLPMISQPGLLDHAYGEIR